MSILQSMENRTGRGGRKCLILAAFFAVFAVVKSSICTGELVAGFRNYENSHFTEVMLIRDPQDLEWFKKIYGLTEVKKEY